MKILSINDLDNLRKRAQQALALREESSDADSEQCCGLATGAEHLQVLCCGGTGCKASNSHKIVENLKAALEENGIADKVDVITTGCFGFCEKGPIVKIIPDNTFYTQVKPEDAVEIVKEHIIGGRRVERLLYVDPKTKKSVSDSKHMDFYRKQMRIALRNCGLIDPENIEEYIARDGYQAIANALLNQTPEQVIDIIKASGLRGRGGAGFPTGMKWGFARGYESDEKYVVGNAVMIHSVSSVPLAAEIERIAAKKDLTVSVLAEVNIADEATKHGIGREEAVELVRAMGEMPHLSVEGLMCIAPPVEDPEENRPYFAAMRELLNEINVMELPGVHLHELSMGMSGDYAVAAEEGATFVRVGTALFGARQYPV